MRYLGTCEQVIAWLSDYLDEDLDGESGVEVEKHLRGCGTCQAFADSLRRIIELCRAYEPSVKPRALTPSARTELERAWQKALADPAGWLEPRDIMWTYAAEATNR